jgi:MFS family permease
MFIYLSIFFVFGFNNIMTTASPSFILFLGGSLSQAGLQNSVFITCAIILRALLSPLVDRVGIKASLFVGAAAFMLTTPLFMFCTGFWQVLVLRTVQAIGLAAYMPSASAFLTVCVRPDRLGICLGVFRITTSASLIIGPPLLFPVIDAYGYTAFFPLLFVMCLLGVLCLFALPNHSTPAPAPLTLVNGGEHRGRDCGYRYRGGLLSFDRWSILVPLIPVLLIQVVSAFAYSSLFFYGMVFMETMLPQANSGVIFTVMSFGGIFSGLAIGILLDKKGSHFAIALNLLLSCLGFAAFFFVDSLLLLVPAALLCGMGYIGCNLSVIRAVGLMTPGSERGFAIFTQQNCLDGGLALGSLFFGIIPSSGLTTYNVFMMLALGLLVCFLTWVVGARNSEVPVWKR